MSTDRALADVPPGTPVAVIVGRPNVGKSSLFNRLVRARRAIVDDRPGVTRDRLLGIVPHPSRPFVCVDTGGIDADAGRETEIGAAVRRHVLDAVRHADVVLFVVDGSTGLSPADVELGRLLLRTGRPLVLVVNKIDTPAHESRVAEYHRLGIDPVLATSAEHARGITELVDAIAARLPATGVAPEAPTGTRLAVIGRPNVGKSTLVNRLVGQERVVVAPTAGTTRDTVDVPVRIGGRPYVLIDTAGIRRRSRIRDPIEGHGAVRALGMLSRAELVAMVLEAPDGMTDQDARVIGRALAAGRGVLLVANKWDVLPAGTTVADWRRRIEGQHRALSRLPAVAVSARTGEGMRALAQALAELERAYRRRVDTGALNRILARALAAHPPPSPGGRPIRFFYGTQTRAAPPEFAIFTSAPTRVPPAFVRHLENVLRDECGFLGVPIVIRLRARREARTTARPPAAESRVSRRPRVAPAGRRSPRR